MSSSSVVRIDVPFAAPVPRGHQVGYALVRHPEAEVQGELLFDLSAAVTYCEDRLHGVLAHVNLADDPFLLAREHGWAVERQVLGRVVGALVSTQPGRVRSTLFVDTSRAPATPYR